jgi:hypothetical protein
MTGSIARTLRRMSAIKSACVVVLIGTEVVQPPVQERLGSLGQESAEVSADSVPGVLSRDGSRPMVDDPAGISTACPRFWLRQTDQPRTLVMG